MDGRAPARALPPHGSTTASTGAEPGVAPRRGRGAQAAPPGAPTAGIATGLAEARGTSATGAATIEVWRLCRSLQEASAMASRSVHRRSLRGGLGVSLVALDGRLLPGVGA